MSNALCASIAANAHYIGRRLLYLQPGATDLHRAAAEGRAETVRSLLASITRDDDVIAVAEVSDLCYVADRHR